MFSKSIRNQISLASNPRKIDTPTPTQHLPDLTKDRAMDMSAHTIMICYCGNQVQAI